MKIKGKVDLYEHEVPFELEFNLHIPSVEAAIRDGYESTPEENVAAYLGDYVGANIIVEKFEF